MKSWINFLKQGFATLLCLYPARFQQEFGTELRQVFSDLLDETASRGGAALAGACLRELADLLPNLLRQHLIEFGKETWMDRLFPDKPAARLAWLGALAFGSTGGLSAGFGIFSGLAALPAGDYTAFTLLGSALLGILLTGAAAAVLWLGAAPHENQWGFLTPVLGAGVFRLLLSTFWVLVVPKSPVYNQAVWLFWGYGWPFLRALLWGAVFGGWFGLAYFANQGRQVAARFALIGAFGQALGYALGQFSINLAYQANLLSGELVTNLSNPWFVAWDITLAIIQGMLFGALMGWLISRTQQRTPLPAG